ncbi:MAG: hypothetical protein CMO82_11075 [Winogradskyella sp.]|jgi:hypothetical protein|nr:hypothetical protein [Winogradskyella sp.]|tara:strand:- start:109 stop:435 length:327 start_codon:yes stop_codon:yes gene_type:complete
MKTRDTAEPTMSREEMADDYSRLKREYTLLHEEYRRLQSEKDKQLKLYGVVNRQGTVNLKRVEEIQERINLLSKLKKEFEEYNRSKQIHTKEVEILQARIKELEWVLN